MRALDLPYIPRQSQLDAILVDLADLETLETLGVIFPDTGESILDLTRFHEFPPCNIARDVRIEVRCDPNRARGTIRMRGDRGLQIDHVAGYRVPGVEVQKIKADGEIVRFVLGERMPVF